MDSRNDRRHAVVLLIVAVALVGWAVAGFVDNRDAGWGAFTYLPDYTVDSVGEGGAAEAAGLQLGDRVISVEGIAVEDLPLYSRWPRSLAPKAGDMRRLIVERGGEQVTVDVVYVARGANMLQIGAALVVLSFMASGLWAIFAVRTSHARMLAHVGMAAGVCVLGGGGPYLGTWDGVKMLVDVAALVLWTLLLLRFFLTFPEPKRMGRSRIATGVLYAPWVLLLGCLVLELIVHPKLYHAFGTPVGLLMLVYMLLTLAALVHTAMFSARGRLRETGVSLILWGVLIAVVPTVVGVMAFTLRLDLPGSDYYALAMAALPVTMALAVRRRGAVILPSSAEPR